jgi:flagellar basal-body rod protein FlgC
MISSAMNIAVSGLNAASTRLNNSANNVANLSSTQSRKDGQSVNEAFQPQDVIQTSVESGGVQTSQRTREPATIPVFQPDNPAAGEDGITQFPNVNLEEEVVTQQFAKYDFQANLKVLETADEMAQDLLDLTA